MEQTKETLLVQLLDLHSKLIHYHNSLRDEEERFLFREHFGIVAQRK